MAKVSKESATQSNEFGPVSERADQLGDYTVNFLVFHEDIDPRPLYRGLPNDRCQCPHWGYMLKGRMVVQYADHEEICEAGDAFYMPPGHVPVKHEARSELVLFSPAAELRKTEEVMERNLEAMSAG